MTAKEVLDQFAEEELPEFVGLSLNDVNQRGNFGDYPLHVACMRGNLEQAIALLSGGAHVNASGEMEYLPIHWAIDSGNPKLVEMLVKAGADLNARNGFGDTTRSLAKRSDNQEIRLLIENAD